VKRILIDSDGVVVDFINAFLHGYVVHGGIIPDGWEVSHFDSIKELPTKKALRAVWEDRFLFRVANPYPGAIDKLQQLNREYEVFIVTAYGKRADIHIPAKFAWYKKRASFLNWDQFIFTNQKHMIAGDVLIEDKQTTINRWASDHPQSRVICIRHPWNGPSMMPNVTYAGSLAEVEV